MREGRGEHILETMVYAHAFVGNRAPRWWTLSAVAVATCWVVPLAASAAEPCPVRIVGGDDLWIRAGRDLARQLGSMPGAVRCAAIEVRVDHSGHLSLIDSDGRRAQRELGQPFELGPSVQALLVDLDASAPGDSAPPASSSPETDTQTTRLAEISNRERSAGSREGARAPAKDMSFVLGTALGARYGAGIATPTLNAFGALRLGRWELGVMGNWEISYKSVAEDGPPWTAAGLSAGISVGRRERVSSNLDFLLGGTIAAAVLHQETHVRRPEQEATNGEGRLGGYLGVVAPARAALRFRAQVQADATAVGPTQRAIAADVPALPAWAIGAQVGVEGDAL